MKKKVIFGAFFVAIAMVGAVVGGKSFGISSAEDNLLMENVEALSSGEGGGGNRIKCYTSFKYESGASVVDCTTCSVRNNQTDALLNMHDYCYK